MHRNITDPHRIAKAVKLKNYYMDDGGPFMDELHMNFLKPDRLSAKDGWSNAIYHDTMWGDDSRPILCTVLKLLDIKTISAINVLPSYDNWGFLHEVGADDESIYEFAWENSAMGDYLYIDENTSVVAHSTFEGYTVISTERNILEQALGHSVYRNWLEFRQGVFCGETWFKYEEVILGHLEQTRVLFEWGRQYEFT